MKFQLSILFSFIAYFSFSQGIEPSQIQGASKINQILQAKNMYIDEYGDTLYIYEHTDLNGAPDSLFVRNDTIYLRDGSGFAKIQTNPDSLFLRNDTIYLRDGSGFVKIPASGLKGSGVATRVAFWGGADSLSHDANLYWDNVNKRLGVGTDNPTSGRLVINRSYSNTGFGNVTLEGFIPSINWGGTNKFFLGSGYANSNILSLLGGSSSSNPTTPIANFRNDGFIELLDSVYISKSLRVGNSISEFSFNSTGLNPTHSQFYVNLSAGKSFRIQAASSLAYMEFYTPPTGLNRNFRFATSYYNNGDFNLLRSSSAGGTPTSNVWTANDNGFGINESNPQYTLDVGGGARIQNRTGTAVTGAGFDANGKLVSYSLDTSSSAPETYINSGDYINITGNGSMGNPYVISSTDNQNLSTNGNPGNISIFGGNNITLNVNDADSIATNELQDLYPYSTGFNLSNPNISLQDTVLFDYQASGSGAFVPASNYVAGTGINITGNTISSTVTNTDAQAISKSGNVISITGNASTVNIANGTPTEGQVMTWQSGNWVPATPSAGIQFFDAVISSPYSGSNGTPTVLTLSLGAGSYKVDAFCKISNETGTANTLSLQLFNQNTGVTLFTSSAQIPSFGNVTIPVARNFTIASTNTIGLRVSTSFNFFINTNECILNALKVN